MDEPAKTSAPGADPNAAIPRSVLTINGGPLFTEPQRVTPALLKELRRMKPYDPEHLPAEIQLIELFRRHCRKLPQVACFDTAFHRDMPRVARLLPIPRHFEAKGIQRYG